MLCKKVTQCKTLKEKTMIPYLLKKVVRNCRKLGLATRAKCRQVLIPAVKW